jgi:hypothetical protein
MAVLAVFATTAGADRPAGAQARMGGPYLDILWNYRDGHYQEAIDQIAIWPIDNVRERAFADLDTAVIVAHGGFKGVSEGKRFSMVKIWLASGSAEELFAEPALVKLLTQTDSRVPRDTWNRTTRQQPGRRRFAASDTRRRCVAGAVEAGGSRGARHVFAGRGDSFGVDQRSRARA